MHRLNRGSDNAGKRENRTMAIKPGSAGVEILVRLAGSGHINVKPNGVKKHLLLWKDGKSKGQSVWILRDNVGKNGRVVRERSSNKKKETEGRDDRTNSANHK